MGIETLMNSGIMEVFIGTGVRGDTHAAVYRVFFPPVLGSHSLRSAAAADAGPGKWVLRPTGCFDRSAGSRCCIL